MASLMSRLLSRLGSKKHDDRKTRRARSRKLRLEPMESRRLLAGDIANISGNVFVDLTDDGFDVGDTAIVGTNVFLYRDGGNGTLDSTGGVAGGDDVLVGTQVSDANGDYSFVDLIAGTYIVEQEAAPGVLQRTTESPKTVVISEAQASGVLALNIDTFDTTTQTLQANAGTPTANDFAVTAANETVGDERDLEVNFLSGGNNVDVTVSGGLLSVSTGAGTTGNAIITYDGADGDASTIDHAALGGIDLTTSGGAAFQFLAGSEAGNTLTIDIFTNATDFSTINVPLPVTPGAVATENLIVRYTDFATAGGAGADFTNVSAIRLQIDMAAATDAQIDFTQAVSPFVSTQNFPNLNPMSIGDLIFADVDNDGVLDAGEVGIAGVDVELYQDSDSSNGFSVGDALVGSTTTDGTGNYSFTGLLPGDYLVLVPITEFATNADPLFGFITSSGNDPAPDPDADDSNTDDNGVLVVGVGVATAAVTLASGAEPATDGDTDTNTNFSLDFGFAPQIDVGITKVADVSTQVAGNQVVYTLTVTNNGNATANNVLVTDNLPDTFTIDSIVATGGGTVTQTGNTAGEITVAYGSLASAQSETITITVTIPPEESAAAAVTNTATVTGDGVDTDPTNDSDSVDIAVTRAAVLTITKTDTPDPSTVGSQLTFTILVTNTGASTATNVVVEDTLPTGLTFDSVTTDVGTAGEAAGVVTANIPSLAVGASATVTIVSTIQSTFSGTTVANSATAVSDEAPLVTATSDTTVNPQVDLAITKVDDVDPVNRGGQITYTLAVTNNGPSTATNVQVIDTLPADVTFVSATGGTVTGPVAPSTDVTIDVGTLASGASTNVTITVDVLQAAGATITNTAIVQSDESTAGFDTDTTNNSATETTATQGTIDLAITKADSVDPAIPGQPLTYTLVVTNNGPSDATGVTVTDNLPDGIQVTSATSTVGTVSVPASAQDTTPANADDLTVAVGNLASGASATVTVIANVLSSATGTLTNVATVATTTTTLIESDSTNNSATETTTLTPSIDLAVTKVDSTDPLIAGNSLTYTITVTNNGPSNATNVNITDTLPAGVTFTSVTSSQGTITNTAGVVGGNLGTLASGSSATITLIVGVDGDTRGTLSNTVAVSADETDSDTTNDSATATTTVNGNVDLVVTKTDSADPVIAGDQLTYTILVTNNGPSDATSVVVADTLPATLTFVSATTTAGTVANTGNAITANIPTIVSGQSATITVVATVLNTATGTISNTATVSSGDTETNSANNTSTQSTAVAELGSIAGKVYVDANRNGVRDTGEAGIAGVTITLTGTDVQNNAVNQSTTTDANGDYLFANLVPGTYTLTQTQPEGFSDGASNVGTGTTNGGTATNNQIGTITLADGEAGLAFDFGDEFQPLSKRRFLASFIDN